MNWFVRLSKENKEKYNFTLQRKKGKKGGANHPSSSSPPRYPKKTPLQPLHNPLPLRSPIPLKLHQQLLIHLSQQRTTLQLPHQRRNLARQRRNLTRHSIQRTD